MDERDLESTNRQSNQDKEILKTIENAAPFKV